MARKERVLETVLEAVASIPVVLVSREELGELVKLKERVNRWQRMDELTVSISWRAAPAWSSCLTPSVKGTNVETTKTVLNTKNRNSLK